MQDEFLARLSAAWGDQAPLEETAIPSFHDRAVAALESGLLEPVVVELETALEQYRALEEISPNGAGPVVELLEAYLSAFLSRDQALMGEAYAGLEEYYEDLAATVQEELRLVDVSPAYGPVEPLLVLVRAYLKGRTDRQPVREFLQALRPEVEQGARASAASRAQFRRKMADMRPPELAARVMELMERGYARALDCLRILEHALEARDIERMGEAMRGMNQGFKLLTQARQSCDEAAEGQKWL